MKIYIPVGVIFALVFVPSMFLATLLSLSIFPLIRYRKVENIFASFILLDLFLTININVWLGVFIVMIEILALLVVYRKLIWEIMNDFANKK